MPQKSTNAQMYRICVIFQSSMQTLSLQLNNLVEHKCINGLQQLIYVWEMAGL